MLPLRRLVGPSRLAIRQLGTTPAPPIAIMVSVKIEETRTEAFLEAMAIDARGSRGEKGCHTFDLLRDSTDPQKFYFYEGSI